MKLIVTITMVGVFLSGTVFASPGITKADIDAVRTKAIKTVEDLGIDAAQPALANPSNEMFQLDPHGLHVWAMTRGVMILFDLSNQTAPGMSVSGFTLENGEMLDDWVVGHSGNPEGGGGEYEFPHPVSDEVQNSYMSCQPLPSDADVIICAMAWGHAG